MNRKKDKELVVKKTDIARKMISSKKYQRTPPEMPRSGKMPDMTLGYKHGPEGKNLTYRKDKRFTKDSSNGALRKAEPVAGGWEND